MNISCYDNRELSWLKFNERVLEEAEDERVPLCERLSFLSIFQSNLDEFFMVRIGSLQDKMLLDDKQRENKTHMTASEQIQSALKRIRELLLRRDKAYAKLMKSVKNQGISLMDFDSLTKDDEKTAVQLFTHDFFPLLSPSIVSKKQAFPFLKNKEIYAVALLCDKSKQRSQTKFGIVPCSSEVFPRFFQFPGHAGDYALSEELIFHYLHLMFPGYKVASKCLIRITRNADIDADSFVDDGLGYREHMAEVIKRRSKLCPVRIETNKRVSPELMARLSQLFDLDRQRIFSMDSPLDLKFVFSISDLMRTKQELFYPSRHPQPSKQIDEQQQSIISQIEDHDVLLHYPYQSIRPFLRLLSEAAHSPDVVSIKMTLYRLARDSKVVESLVEAAENGKQVDVLVELKARFDEENNIEWSRRLERAGCHVIYGIDRLKVHSKLCLITKKSGDTLRYITQIGTGNYNEKTSRLYTDLSLITANQEIGMEANRVFQSLMLGETMEHTDLLLVAPHCLQNKLVEMIDEEIEKAKAGEKGLIRLKLNSLSDKTLIDKLIDASQAGVKVQMVIRGICCMVAGIEGYTDNIEIVSIVGRFLEHSRIYIFGEGESARCYISSADWMTRNTLRRVEIATPVLDSSLISRLENIFSVLRSDNVQARVQQSDGTYLRRFPGDNEPISAQEVLYDMAYSENQ